MLFRSVNDIAATVTELIAAIKADIPKISKPTNRRDRIKSCSRKKAWLTALHDQDNHDGVITHTHLEPDIMKCQVKWALGSITVNTSGGDGIPVELFQILKDGAVKALHSICQQTWKTQQWPQDWKRSVFIPVPKKGNANRCSNYYTSALISHTNAQNSPISDI